MDLLDGWIVIVRPARAGSLAWMRGGYATFPGDVPWQEAYVAQIGCRSEKDYANI